MIVKTPLRVSLLGGGSDMFDHFNKNDGHVVGLTINKYIHNAAVKIRFDQGYKFRLSYRLNEEVQSSKEIIHPIYKIILNKYELMGCWHFLSITDIPAGSGLGSSSTFTVGLLKLVKKILDKDYNNPEKIALEAIDIERNKLNESGGWQDQIHAAYTGINEISFKGNKFSVNKVKISKSSEDLLNKSMFIMYSGINRDSSSIESSKNVVDKTKIIDEMVKLSKDGARELSSPNIDLRYLGTLLKENWILKKNLSDSVSSKSLDELHNTIIKSGAYGAKLCGAGGGGFFFVLSDQNSINKLKTMVNKNTIIEQIKMSSHDDTYVRDEL